MSLVRLKVPSQDRLDSGFASRTSAQVEAWLDELPRGNAEALAAATRDALIELNRSPLRRANRFDVMELLRPAVHDACAMLVGLYKSASFPLPEDDQNHADLVRQLFAELATGFKICVNEQLDLWQRERTEPTTLVLQLAIQRGILALGRTLLESYRVYSAEPPFLWRDLHALYRNSELAKLQALPIQGTRDSDETALSIKQAYLRVAVLAMANPYHLMQGEAEELYRRIGRWVHFVQIRAASPGEDLAGQFMLDLDSDLPARYLPRKIKLPAPSEPRVLGLERLVGTISAQIDRSNEILVESRSSNTLSERMQRDMYVRFRDALGGRNERTTERKATIARLTLVEGLSGCHFFLNGRRLFTPEQDETEWDRRVGGTKENKSLNLTLLDDDEIAKRRGLDLQKGRASKFEGYDLEADDIWRKANLVTPSQQQTRRLRRSRYQAVTWNRKNESSGGIALFCAQDCPAQAKVGELVTYANDDSVNPADWRVGTIRWLRTRPNGGLELGIKHLADGGYAVGTQAVSGAGKGAEYLRSIVLPRVNPLVKTATLITPAAVYDCGTVVRLNMKEMLIYAELTELIETTRLFTHFRFKVVEAPAQAKSAPRPAGPRKPI